jgi:quinol monooxygenase YgiN
MLPILNCPRISYNWFKQNDRKKENQMKKITVTLSLFALAVSSFTPGLARAQGPGGIQAAAPNKVDYVLFVEVKVKPESVLDFKEALLSVVAPTRAEPGNYAYIVHQSPTDPTDFMFYEHWQSDEYHERHLQSPCFLNYSNIVTPMMEPGYPIRKKMIDLD